jgi:hypothetical protein
MGEADEQRKREQARERARRWRQRWPEKHKARCAAWHDKQDPTRWSAQTAQLKPDDDLLAFAIINTAPRRGPRSYQRRTQEATPLSIREIVDIEKALDQERQRLRAKKPRGEGSA